MTTRIQKVKSTKVSVKRGQCKKGVKEDDGSAIKCESFQFWFHCICAHLTEEEIKCLGTKRNCAWLGYSFVEQNNNIFTTSKIDAELNGLFDSLNNKYTLSMQN